MAVGLSLIPFSLFVGGMGHTLGTMLLQVGNIGKTTSAVDDDPTTGAEAPRSSTYISMKEVLTKYGTDKEVGHGYSGLYDVLLSGLQGQDLHILEIGLGTQKENAESRMNTQYQRDASLFAWREYFPKASVYGLDIQDDVMLQNEERIQTGLADSTNKTSVDHAISQFRGCDTSQGCFDVVIEDGLHTAVAQVATLRNIMPYVKCGGSYFVEDVEYVEKDLLMHKINDVKEIIGPKSALFFADDFNINPDVGKPWTNTAVLVIRKHC